MSKMCPKCKVVKPLNGFSKNKGKKDKLSSYCKSCIKPYVEKYRKNDNYKEKRKKHDIKYKKSEKGKKKSPYGLPMNGLKKMRSIVKWKDMHY